MTFLAAEAAMWQHVQRYTGQVGYQRGVKAEGLAATPPAIDCSGWVRVLLTAAMQAENETAGRALFRAADIDAMQVWSDRLIQEIATRTDWLLQSADITLAGMPRCAAIGIKMGEPAWAANHPRSRGITHIVQVVRRPEDDAPFVSEAFGGSTRKGILLTPLAQWLTLFQPHIDAGEMWVVDPLRLAANTSPGEPEHAAR